MLLAANVLSINHPVEYLEYFWEWTKLVFSVLWNHLPLFLTFLAIGCLVGVLACYLLFRFFKKSPFFSRPVGLKRTYRYWLKTAKVLSLLALFSFCLVTSVCFAARKAMKIEISNGVDSCLTEFAEYFFGREEGRQKLELVYSVLIDAGEQVDAANQAVAETLAAEYTANSDRNGLMRYFDSIFLIGNMKSRIESMEKEVVYILIEIALDAVHAKDLVSFDAFESSFDAWLEKDLSNDLSSAREFLTEMIWRYAGPAVTSVFIPALLICALIVFFPFFDTWVFRYRRKRQQLGAEGVMK